MAFNSGFKFIDPKLAEDRDVFCGNCNMPVKGHYHRCPHCSTKFYPNMHGYARLCKSPTCRRTEQGGHAHALCRYHHEDKRKRQMASALQPNCRCGNKATYGYRNCSRCRTLAAQQFNEYYGV